MINLKNICMKINEQTILEDISLNLESGKCYGFVGNNGCGKTMLLRAICGYKNIDSGTVEINHKIIGKDVDFIDDAGIIIGEMQFMNALSGFDNLKILAEIKKKITDKEILEIMKIFGIYGARQKKVKKYSLGMKQRLRLAQAFMEEPKILILDEPFNGLDKDGIAEVQAQIQSQKRKGNTILLTCHDDRNINLLCDEVYEMDNGRIIS